MSSKLTPGDYEGVIVEHGTEIAFGTYPAVWFDVKIDTGEIVETVHCRFLMAGKTEEKTATAIRMARAGLKLCGFDPDKNDIEMLDLQPMMLRGTKVPVRAVENERSGKFYMNFDIALPRALDSGQTRKLTDLLRKAKSKDEPETTAPVKVALAPKPEEFPKETIDKARAEGVKPMTQAEFDDIPF